MSQRSKIHGDDATTHGNEVCLWRATRSGMAVRNPRGIMVGSRSYSSGIDESGILPSRRSQEGGTSNPGTWVYQH
jgi:hypothetical protein